MGDNRRFSLFASMIAVQFPADKYRRVADVAGGKGYLQVALQEHGYTVTTFDRRNRRAVRYGPNYQYRYFGPGVRDEFDLLVGLHPDEATDVIIVEAARRRLPFAVCPCCVMPNQIAFWEHANYKNWIAHLTREATRRGFTVDELQLRMSGRSRVLIGRISGR